MLIGEELSIAEAVFRKVSRELSTTKRRTRRYWVLVGYVQELANYGFAKAKQFMKNVDVSQAPSSFGEETTFKYLFEGPRTTSYKGARRQLQADPASPHKTFGMRPLNKPDYEPKAMSRSVLNEAW